MPVNCGSSQLPSARCVRASQRTPRSVAALSLSRRDQGEQRPGGLRRGGLAPSGQRLVVVGAQVLAPAAVRVLVLLQPGHGAAVDGLDGFTPAAISAGTTAPVP